MTTVINKYHQVPFDIDISRQSIWGNPFSSTGHGTYQVETKEEAIKNYDLYLRRSPKLWLKLRELKDKVLGCTCKPKDCHGDILVKYANLIGSRVWHRKHENGYEVSSIGDKRFSAFYAKMPDGRSIEEHYQCDIKGYKTIAEGKGKPPLGIPGRKHVDRDGLFGTINYDKLYQEYLGLWKVWSMSNISTVVDLAMKAGDSPLTDMFASTDINQARALTDLLNELTL